MSLPSPVNVALKSMLALSTTRTASPPVAGMTYICATESFDSVTTNLAPSGDQFGA